MPRLLILLVLFPIAVSAQPLLVPANDSNVVYEVADGTLYRSDDGGATFTKRRAIDSVNAVDPNDPNLLYDSRQGDVRRSDDGGLTWTSIGGPLPSFTPSPRELVVTPSGAVFLASTCYRDHTGGGVFRSDDKGFSWSTSLVGQGQCVATIGVAPLSDQFYSMNELDLLYGESTTPRAKVVAGAQRPGLRYGLGYLVSNYQIVGAMVVMSDDGGKRWTRLTNTDGAPYDLALDDHSGRVFLATSSGLYMSGDHAKTWRRVPKAPADPRVLLVGGTFLYLGTAHGNYRAPLATLRFAPLGKLP